MEEATARIPLVLLSKIVNFLEIPEILVEGFTTYYLISTFPIPCSEITKLHKVSTASFTPFLVSVGAAIYVDGALRRTEFPVGHFMHVNSGTHTYTNTAYERNHATDHGGGSKLCIYGEWNDNAIFQSNRWCGNTCGGIEAAALRPECGGSGSLLNSVFGGNIAQTNQGTSSGPSFLSLRWGRSSAYLVEEIVQLNTAY